MSFLFFERGSDRRALSLVCCFEIPPRLFLFAFGSFNIVMYWSAAISKMHLTTIGGVARL
jgi:hypothetical protein